MIKKPVREDGLLLFYTLLKDILQDFVGHSSCGGVGSGLGSATKDGT